MTNINADENLLLHSMKKPGAKRRGIAFEIVEELQEKTTAEELAALKEKSGAQTDEEAYALLLLDELPRRTMGAATDHICRRACQKVLGLSEERTEWALAYILAHPITPPPPRPLFVEDEEPQVHRHIMLKAFAAAKEQGEMPEFFAKYGYSYEYPVLVKGFAGTASFFGRLRHKDGYGFTAVRRGSAFAPDGSEPIDHYELYHDQQKWGDMYINAMADEDLDIPPVDMCFGEIDETTENQIRAAREMDESLARVRAKFGL